MSVEINYKKKYLELRNKYINDLDMAFRLGVEQGMKQAQEQQAIEAEANAKQMQMQQQQIEAQGMGGQNAPQEGGEQPGSEAEQPGQPGVNQMEQQGSELDQHISKLESALGSNPEPEIQKSLHALVTLRKSHRDALDMKKAEAAIKGISKALHKPGFKFGIQASANLTDNAKKSVTLQHKIVNDVMKAWAEEDSKASKEIKNILDIDGLMGK